MADTLEFYRTRAAEERKRAEEATLDNVRERCQRAEAAWMAMAARAEGVANARKQRDENVVHASTVVSGP